MDQSFILKRQNRGPIKNKIYMFDSASLVKSAKDASLNIYIFFLSIFLRMINLLKAGALNIIKTTHYG